MSKIQNYVKFMEPKGTDVTIDLVREYINKHQKLASSRYEILKDKDKISSKDAKEKAYLEYDQFNKTQKIESDFDKQINKMLKENGENI